MLLVVRRRRRQGGRGEDRDVPRVVVALRAGQRAHAQRDVGREHERRLAEGRGRAAQRSARRGRRPPRSARRSAAAARRIDHQSGVDGGRAEARRQRFGRGRLRRAVDRAVGRHGAARGASGGSGGGGADTRSPRSRRNSARSSARCAKRSSARPRSSAASTSCSASSARVPTRSRSSSTAPTSTSSTRSRSATCIPQIKEIPGIGRPDTNITPSQPEVDINVDRRVAAQLGLSTGDVANIVSTATSGTIASYWQTNGTQYPIMVQLPAEQRRSLDALSSLLINPGTASAGGGRPRAAPGRPTRGNRCDAPTRRPRSRSMPCRSRASRRITLGQGPSQIPRQNKARRVDIDAPLAGDAVLGDVLGQVTDDHERLHVPVRLPLAIRSRRSRRTTTRSAR